MRALDVFCLPSYANEGVPQSLMQAMLLGLPIISTPVGSILEIVDDGRTGLIVPPRDAKALAAAIARLLDASRAHVALVLRPSGEQALANVQYIAELARQYEASGGISFRGFVEQLRDEAASVRSAEAPILEEGSEGVRLMTGTDSVTDHWSPFGTADMLEKANLCAQLYAGGDELSLSRAMTIATGDILPLDDQGEQVWPKAGDRAEFVLVGAASSAEAVARRTPRTASFHNGRLAYGRIGQA